MSDIKQFKFFKGIYEKKLDRDSVLLTKNLVPGIRVYGENLYTVKDEAGERVEYRDGFLKDQN